MTQDKRQDADDRYVCRVTIDAQNPDQAKKDEQGRLHSLLQRKQGHAVILHPSLGCPLLVEEGKPISFFILSDSLLFMLHRNCQEKKSIAQADLAVRQVIGLHARYQLFSDAMQSKTKPVVEGKLVCQTRDQLLQNLSYKYMGDIRELGGRLEDSDAEHPFIGQIHPLASNHFRQHHLNHLFKITIKGLNLTAGALYDLSWISYDETREHDAEEEPPLTECQDDYVQDFLKLDRYIGEPQRKCVPVSPLTFGENGRGHLLETHHPVWVVPGGKPRLGVGHLTDVHVSSRQHAFRKSQARLIPKTSEAIGPKVNTSFDCLKDLMSQFGSDPDIDLLVITGDLIDYGRNYNPACLTDTRTGNLWKEMNLDHLNQRDEKGNLIRKHGQPQPDTKRYPRGIDNAIVYSLLRWYLKSYKKPVLLAAGNHEAYTLPYGISSRIKRSWVMNTNTAESDAIEAGHPIEQEALIERAAERVRENRDEISKKGAAFYYGRANDGIAADHNLTIPEAVLMYGPDYGRVIAEGTHAGSGYRNFNPANLDWFSIICTPLSDYALSWNEQCFMLLGWGDSEIFFELLGKQGTGFLPRATESLSEGQQELVERAIGFGKPCNLLCAHFTFVNYRQETSLNRRGTVSAGEEKSDRGDHDFGTFERHRDYIYTRLHDERIHYTLSGHSHRAGLYQIAGRTGDSFSVLPRTIGKNKTRYKPHQGARLIVSGSGGPIAVQNHDGELYHWGLDTPSGSYIKFSGSQEREIGIKRANVPQAKPRLAVALDYADIICRDEEGDGIFESFESTEHDGPFTIKINPKANLPEVDWIAGIALYVVTGRGRKPDRHTMKLTYDRYRYFATIDMEAKLMLNLSKQSEKSLYFLSIDLKGDILNRLPTDYDLSTPWTFQVEIEKRFWGGFRILRHSKWGEVPQHWKYSQIDSGEYIYAWETSAELEDSK